MASNGADSLILDSDRAPIDNRQQEESTQSSSTLDNQPTLKKKKTHTKKPVIHKDKRNKDQASEGTTTTGTTSTSSTSKDATKDKPEDKMVIPPQILKAIKSSLKDDLFQICQQACNRQWIQKIPLSLPHLTHQPI